METLINNRFEIKKKLGEGGFGSVYLVHDRAINEVCALKLIRPHLAARKDIQDSFRKEAVIWMEFGQHPNIVTVRAVDLFNGSLFVALEFIPPNEFGACTLDKQIRSCKPSLRSALKWALDICQGMAFAKAKGMIAHRDLKPSNLMIDASSTIKVTDFGLASFLVDSATQHVDSAPSGTPLYMPPEQFVAGARVDERSDIYSFGIVLYEILSGGQFPFKMEKTDPRNYFSYFHQLHSTFVLPRFDSPLYSVIAKCLAKSPQNRYASFAEVSADMKPLYRSAVGEDYRPMTPEDMSANEDINYSASYFMLGDPNRALKHIDRAIAKAPWVTIAHNNKAGILAQLGRIEEAVRIWDELTRRAPGLGKPHYNLGLDAMRKGDLPSAIERYRRAIDVEPDYVPAIVNLAICYQQCGDVKRAIDLYDKALMVNPQDAQIIYNKAFLLYEIDELEESRALFEKVISLNPNHVSAHNYLGLCHHNLGQLETALRCYNDALAIDPDYPHALKNRQLLLNSRRS